MKDLEIIAQLYGGHHLGPRELERAQVLVHGLAGELRNRWPWRSEAIEWETTKAPAGFADRVLERLRASAEPQKVLKV